MQRENWHLGFQQWPFSTSEMYTSTYTKNYACNFRRFLDSLKYSHECQVKTFLSKGI